MLRMGASKPWEDAMEAITGGRTMSAQPMLDYFEPLMKWLKNENAKNKEFVGWTSPPQQSCVKSLPTESSTQTLAPSSAPARIHYMHISLSLLLIKMYL